MRANKMNLPLRFVGAAGRDGHAGVRKTGLPCILVLDAKRLSAWRLRYAFSFHDGLRIGVVDWLRAEKQ
jgi:hypothetical protein